MHGQNHIKSRQTNMFVRTMTYQLHVSAVS